MGKWRHTEIKCLAQGCTGRREGNERGVEPRTRAPACHFSKGWARSRPADNRAGLEKELLGPESGIHLLRPAMFSQGKVGGLALPLPVPPHHHHHLLPIYLFILKSHLPTLPGAPNKPASPQRGDGGERGTVSPGARGSPGLRAP